MAFLLSLAGITEAQLLGQQGNKLVGAGTVGYSPQGVAVAISADGNTAIVGADQDNTNVGGVFFYSRNGTTWSQQGPKMSANDAIGATRQGYSVSISADGNTAVVGGYLDNNPVGAAYVYTRSGGVWTQQGPKLVGTGYLTGSIQGWSVAISGDGNTILVGAYGDDNYKGATWVYTRSGGVWTQQGEKLVGTGGLGSPGHGQSVSLSHDGNTAIIGARNDNGNTGAAWIFARSGGVWSQVSKLVGSGAVGQSWQGISVAMSGDGNTAMVGGYLDNTHTGAAWVFTQSGGVWTQQGTKLVGSDYTSSVQQGGSVSLSYDGNRALVAGWNDNSAIGCAWLYTRTSDTWTQSGSKLLAGDRVGVAKFGTSVALSADGSTAIVGGPYDNSSVGAAWIFATCTSAPPIAAITGATTGTICSGYTLSVADTSAVGQFISSYSWSDGSTGPKSNPITATGTYSVTITNSCGYSSTASVVISTVNASPAPVISGESYFCAGSSVVLAVTDANSTPGPLTYTWSNGSTAASSNPINTIGAYSVSITNGYGCTVSATQTIISNPISITSTGGTGASGICYTTLKAGFDAINNGTHTGEISILVLGNTTETVSSVLNGSGMGSASYTGISIKPSGGAARIITTGLSNQALIELNGANNVVINGLNTGGNSLTFTNTSVAATPGTSTLRFINDASNNIITNCTILGNSAGSVGNAGAGTICFSTALVSGNDNNVISYCNISSSHATSMATRHIYMGGTVGMENDGNLVDNNNIYNYFRTTVNSAAIDVAAGSTGVVISNNKFYQTASRTFTSTNLFHRAISINNTNGNGYQVLNNRIGFTDSLGTGTYTFSFSGTASVVASFAPIYLNVGGTTATSVQGNTIAGIAISGNTVGTGTNSPFKGIHVNNGLVNIGDISGNTIGSMSAAGSITYTSNSTSSSASDVIGILVAGSSNSITSNNNIGGITVNTTNKVARNFYGIRSMATGSGTWICNNNTIGGDIANSIIHTGVATSSKMNGITNTALIGFFAGNTIRNMRTSGGTGSGSGSALIGICLTGANTQTLSQNKIYHLTSSTTEASEVYGILASTSAANIVERNLIYGFSSSSLLGTTLTGIQIENGTGTYSNNMITLGEGITTPSNVYGFNETNGINNILHNSVYIGGAPTAGAFLSAAFLSSRATNTGTLVNNIFSNARSNEGTATAKHYSIALTDASAGSTINNNLYYVTGTGSIFGRFNSVDAADLSAWKIATAQDVNSITGDPAFAAPTADTPNLRINVYGSPIVDAAGMSSTTTEDFDGQTRSSLTPTDIGAHAFIAIPCTPTSAVWLGHANTLWSNTANWSCGVLPTAISNVTISGTAPNMPVVDITDAVCNDLTIGSGAGLTISIANALDIKGAVSNSGSFTTLGKAEFSGTAQIIPAGTYADMVISGTGTKSLSGTVSISNLLTLGNSVELGAYDMSIGAAGSITGGSASSYIIITGSGALKQQGIGIGGRASAVSFPIGTSASFTPLAVTNAGTADEFSVRVISNVFDAYDANDIPTGTAQTKNNIDRTWTVKETVPGGSDVTLDFQWNSGDELPEFDRLVVIPSHYKNSKWNKGTTTTAAGSGPYTASLSGITTFSPFGVGSTNSIMPLTLISFTSKQITNGVVLEWKTTNEVNTAGFEIERSMNGSGFETIGNVSSGATTTYRYTDNKTVAGSVYTYRLKMIDRDGKYTYSNTIAVTFAAVSTTGYSVYPNPTTDSYLYIKPLTGNTNVNVTVLDLGGRILLSKQLTASNFTNGRFEISVAQLPAGSYLLRISDKNGNNAQTTKFNVGK